MYVEKQILKKGNRSISQKIIIFEIILLIFEKIIYICTKINKSDMRYRIKKETKPTLPTFGKYKAVAVHNQD